ncbi:Hint domain-containing protein, partial [Dactylosporangium sp. NPDC051484]|uniref:Hint domain-containing protein n=1 Tax=Dactylosporangium sp. NPDC051484 TaxID=3154942 RepID=UPI00344C3306
CSADPINCTDLDGKWGWGSIKKALNTVAVVASYASMIPGPIGTICGVVSAVAYVATGNWKEAAWAIAGAAAAVVGAGAAVKAAKVAVTAVKASSKIGNFGQSAARIGRGFARTFSKTCSSFAPGTPVLMANGTWLPIEVVTEGDWVTAIDPVTGERSAQPVLTVFETQGDKHLFEVDLDGDLFDTLTVTDKHPVLVDGKGWVYARDLVAGSPLRMANGDIIGVRGVYDIGQVGQATVYNLNVANIHTYVVGVDGEGLVVHNSSCFSKVPRIFKQNNFGRKLQNSKVFGSESFLFGNKFSGRPGARQGVLNRQHAQVRIGWSAEGTKKKYGVKGARHTFRIGVGKKHASLFYGRWF